MKTHKFACNKLVRDKSLERMKKKNISFRYHTASPTEYRNALMEKLFEEAEEVKTAKNREEIMDEIADVLEVLYALCDNAHISMDEVELKRQATHKLRGGFADKIYLEYIELTDDNPDLVNFTNRPDKYPKIK